MDADSAMCAQLLEIEWIIVNRSSMEDNAMQKFRQAPSAARDVSPLIRLVGTVRSKNHLTARKDSRMPKMDSVFIPGVSPDINSAFMTSRREMQMMQIGTETNATELRSRLRRILFSIFRISFQRKNPPEIYGNTEMYRRINSSPRMMQNAIAPQLSWDISQASPVTAGVSETNSVALRCPPAKASAAGFICNVSTDVISDDMVGIANFLSSPYIPYPSATTSPCLSSLPVL